MIYIDMDPQEFSKKYRIDITKEFCSACRKEFILDVPIAIKGYKGFEMRKHGCPDHRLAAIFKPVDKKEIDFWNGII